MKPLSLSEGGRHHAVSGQLLFTALVIFVLSIGPVDAWAEDWQVVKTKSGAVVKQKAVADSAFKVTRGTLTSSAGLFDLLAVLRDVASCPKWLHKCKFGEVMSSDTVAESLNYTVIDSPLMLKDRDTVVRSRITYSADPERIFIQMTGEEAARSLERKRVRVLDFEGYWLLEKHETGVVLTYQVFMDPQVATKGAANSTLATSVLETLIGVDRLAKTKPYLNSAVSADRLSAITGTIALPE